jgi:hypothetical protein
MHSGLQRPTCQSLWLPRDRRMKEICETKAMCLDKVTLCFSPHSASVTSGGLICQLLLPKPDRQAIWLARCSPDLDSNAPSPDRRFILQLTSPAATSVSARPSCWLDRVSLQADSFGLFLARISAAFCLPHSGSSVTNMQHPSTARSDLRRHRDLVARSYHFSSSSVAPLQT